MSQYNTVHWYTVSNTHISIHRSGKHLLARLMLDFQISISGRQSPTWLSLIENYQMPTVSKSSSLFAKTSHHSVHYSFTALKLSQSGIPCCPLRPVDRTKMAGPHTAEIFVWNCVKLLFDSGMSVKEVTSEAPANSEELCFSAR